MTPKFPAVTSDEVMKVLQKISFRFKRKDSQEAAMPFITGIQIREEQLFQSIKEKS